MLWQCGQACSVPQGAARIAKALDDGSALRTFQAMLEAQGVEAHVARALCAGTEEERLQILQPARAREELLAQSDGKMAPWVRHCSQRSGPRKPCQQGIPTE